jgi:hypothetical protein
MKKIKNSLDALYDIYEAPKKINSKSTLEEVYEQYIGDGQLGIDFEKKDILEAMRVYHNQFQQVTDEEIKRNAPYPEEVSGNKQKNWAWILGAKAMRDGKIVHLPKNEI